MLFEQAVGRREGTAMAAHCGRTLMCILVCCAVCAAVTPAAALMVSAFEKKQ